MKRDIAALVAKVSLFSHLPQSTIDELVDLMQEVTVQAGQDIVTEGMPVDSFFIIVKGEAKVIQKGIILAVLKPGDSIGLSNKGLFSPHGKRTASVNAVADCLLLKMDIITFKSFLKAHPAFDKDLEIIMEKLVKVDFIKQVSSFVHLDNEEIFPLLEQIKEISLPPHTLLFKQNDIADYCYLILSGQIEIFITQEDGSEKSLAILESPDLVGEMALLTRSVRNASVRSLGHCCLLALDIQLLARLIKSNKTFAQSVMGFSLKRLRPAKNKHIVVYEHITKDGQKKVMLHNTDIHQYFQLTPEAWFIWQQIDGLQTIQDLAFIFLKQYKAFVPDMICDLLYTLAETGFVNIPSIAFESELQPPKTLLGKIRSTLKKITHIDISFTHTDGWLTKCYHRGGFLFFTWPCQLFLILFGMCGFYPFLHNYSHVLHVAHTMPGYYWLFLLLIIPSTIIVVGLHELGHAFTAKKFGYKVQRFGIGWFGAGPIAYADTSELWVAEKLPRLMVDIAGVYVEIVLASGFAFLSLYLKHNPWAVFFWLMSFFTYINAFKNLSPLREYDGYAIIMDGFNYPRLRKKTIQWLKHRPLKWRKPEMIYSISCVIYLILSPAVIFLSFLSLFQIIGIKSVFAISISILLALFSVGMAIRGLWRELRS